MIELRQARLKPAAAAHALEVKSPAARLAFASSALGEWRAQLEPRTTAACML